MLLEERSRDTGEPLERCRELRAGVEHQALEQDRLDADEATGAVEQLLREHVRVPGPERMDAAPARERVRDERGRGREARPLVAGEALDEAARLREVAPPCRRGDRVGHGASPSSPGVRRGVRRRPGRLPAEEHRAVERRGVGRSRLDRPVGGEALVERDAERRPIEQEPAAEADRDRPVAAGGPGDPHRRLDDAMELGSRVAHDPRRDLVRPGRREHVRREPGDRVHLAGVVMEADGQRIELAEPAGREVAERRRIRAAFRCPQRRAQALPPDPERAALIAEQVPVAPHDPWLALLGHDQARHAGAHREAHSPAQGQRPRVARHRVVADPHLGGADRLADARGERTSKRGIDGRGRHPEHRAVDHRAPERPPGGLDRVRHPRVAVGDAAHPVDLDGVALAGAARGSPTGRRPRRGSGA